MTNLGRRLASGLVLLAGLAFPVGPGTGSACAAEGSHAALVVDTGDSVQSFCVALPDGDVSGLELIALAKEQHGLTYKLGFGGEAVCMLAGVGPTSDDCFEHYPDFWGYWRGDGNGGWSWSGTGAGSATVGDGDVEGWSWGSGSNGDSHPRPPATTFGDVCVQAAQPPPARAKPPADEETKRGRRPAAAASTGRRPAGLSGPGASARGPGPDGRSDVAEDDSRGARQDPRARARKQDRAEPRAVPPAGPISPAPASFADPPRALEPVGSSGPPAAGIAGLAAAAFLGGTGFVLVRRRRRTGSQ